MLKPEMTDSKNRCFYCSKFDYNCSPTGAAYASIN